MTPEKKSENTLKIPWLERRKQKRPELTTDDIDYLVMLEELARGPQ